MSETDPFDHFDDWFRQAEAKEPNDPNAMALATVGADGMPSLRMVLLKGRDERGFVFYTNHESRKGTQLQAQPKAALCLYWKSLKKQIRIEGEVEQVTAAEADAYFASRQRGSRIGAWASQQSRPLESRFALEKAVAAYAARYAIGEIPRPAYWSGFRVAPQEIEFWSDGTFRLHDRIKFVRNGDAWAKTRLYP
jgi:pyridoxamine 5'-phosphate oxidase